MFAFAYDRSGYTLKMNEMLDLLVNRRVLFAKSIVRWRKKQAGCADKQVYNQQHKYLKIKFFHGLH
jgi:hypothetical protein